MVLSKALTNTTDQGVLYTNTSGNILSTAAPASNNFCLLSGSGGGTPTWGACPGGAGATNYWNLTNGTLNPINSTLDLLVGGQSTSSAVFKVSPSGTSPTASISANTSYAGLVVDNKGLGDLFTASSSGLSRFVIARNGNVGIGTTNPSHLLELAGATTTIGDLLNITHAGSPVFNVNQTQITSSVPHQFTAAGDVSIAYDLQFTNQTASFIKSYGPLSLEAGEGFESNDLTLRTFNKGNIVFDLTGAGSSVSINAPLALATFDVRANSATTPIASFSGSTNFAGLVVDNRGNGDLFTASSSGLNRFVIKQNGAVAIGTNALNFGATDKLVIDGNGSTSSTPTTIRLSNSDPTSEKSQIAFSNSNASGGWYAGIDPSASGADDFFIYGGGGGATRLFINSSGRVGIGTDVFSPLATLDVRGNSATIPAASISASSNFASLLVDNTGNGDIFTASKSGLTQFVVKNSGKVGIGTNLPGWKLHVTDDLISTASAMIENTGANNTAGHTGLIIRLGAANSATDPNANDAFVKFLRGDSNRRGQIIGVAGGVTISNRCSRLC